ncbi:hypothetical protein VNI00_012714 [Paramarasmius palmivorus]|uniref:Uncharacterized protein n=1 Tax=Paramarasmius palmivorus TaxID=297713 RepID=A0AAW0BYX1_9AGAR
MAQNHLDRLETAMVSTHQLMERSNSLAQRLVIENATQARLIEQLNLDKSIANEKLICAQKENQVLVGRLAAAETVANVYRSDNKKLLDEQAYFREEVLAICMKIGCSIDEIVRAIGQKRPFDMDEGDSEQQDPKRRKI